MKREIVTLFAASAAVFLVACGSDSSGTNANDGELVSVQAETFDDLPNCSKSREGDLAEVQDERKAYRCQKGAWEFDHDVLDTVKTEDELPACIGKKEGLSLFVKSESAAYTCDGKRWIKEDAPGESGVVEYETEDDLPNCVVKREGETALIEGEAYLCDGTRWKAVGTYYATEDSLSNCTAKREGEKAYIADEGTALKCIDGEWKEAKAADQGRSEPDDDSPKSSSSTPDPPTSSSTPDTPTSSSTPIEDLSSSSVKVPEPEEGTLTDSRDGQTYKTVVIGTQTWMAENLNYEATGSVCPLKNSAYCKKYGRLYPSNISATSLCPAGWHVPAIAEWTVLYNYVDANNGTEGVGKSLKSTTGWYEAGTEIETRVAVATGEDLFGFSALPAGSCWSGKCYSDDEARFFASGGYAFKISYDSDIFEQDDAANSLTAPSISVRCLKGAATSTTTTSSSSLAKKEITGCTCDGELTTETNDLASDNPVEYTWNVTGCSSEGAEPLSYIWSGSVSGTKSSVTASYTKKGEYTPSVTVTNADGNAKEVTCPSVYVVDSDNPYDEIEFPSAKRLGPGGYYIPECPRWTGTNSSTTIATVALSGSSENCLDWIDGQQVTGTVNKYSDREPCSGSVKVEFPLYITIPVGEYMQFESCW